MTVQLTAPKTAVNYRWKRSLLMLAFVGLTLTIGACADVPAARTEAAGQAIIDQAFDADAARYEAMAEFTTETTQHPSQVLAANPELSAAQRYVPVSPAAIDQPGPDVEVIRHNYFNAFRAAGGKDLHQSYFGDWGIESEAIDQAIGGVTGPAVAFEVASIKQIYFNDWGVEADTIDRIEQPTATDIEVLRHTYLTAAQTAVVEIPQPPATFDPVQVQQTYFSDWAVEADRVDPVVQSIIDEETMLQTHFDGLRQVNVALVNGNATAEPLNLDEGDISSLRQSYFETWQPEAERSDISPIATIDFETVDKDALHQAYFSDAGIEADAVDEF